MLLKTTKQIVSLLAAIIIVVALFITWFATKETSSEELQRICGEVDEWIVKEKIFTRIAPTVRSYQHMSFTAKNKWIDRIEDENNCKKQLKLIEEAELQLASPEAETLDENKTIKDIEAQMDNPTTRMVDFKIDGIAIRMPKKYIWRLRRDQYRDNPFINFRISIYEFASDRLKKLLDSFKKNNKSSHIVYGSLFKGWKNQNTCLKNTKLCPDITHETYYSTVLDLFKLAKCKKHPPFSAAYTFFFMNGVCKITGKTEFVPKLDARKYIMKTLKDDVNHAIYYRGDKTVPDYWFNKNGASVQSSILFENKIAVEYNFNRSLIQFHDEIRQIINGRISSFVSNI